MPDPNAPVTQAEMDAVTIPGLPALVKKMLRNGSEPDPADDPTPEEAS